MHPSSALQSHSRRRTFSALAFVVCALFSSGRLLWQARTPAAAKASSTGAAHPADQRFAELRPLLPQRGVVGYLGAAGAMARGDYYRTEYALAPLVVDDSLNHPLVIVNFPDSPMVPPANLQLVKDFGNGLALFVNPGAR